MAFIDPVVLPGDPVCVVVPGSGELDGHDVPWRRNGLASPGTAGGCPLAEFSRSFFRARGLVPCRVDRKDHVELTRTSYGAVYGVPGDRWPHFYEEREGQIP